MVNRTTGVRFVRPAAFVIAALALIWLTLAWARMWHKRTETPAEVVHRGEVETSFRNAAADLTELTPYGGAVTSIAQLKFEWGRRFPSAPPIFKIYEPSDLRNGEYPYYGLPARDYFCLRNWSTNDLPSTPFLWSYFATPWGVDVVYLAIDASVHHCSSNEFTSLVAPLSNRVERAALTR